MSSKKKRAKQLRDGLLPDTPAIPSLRASHDQVRPSLQSPPRPALPSSPPTNLLPNPRVFTFKPAINDSSSAIDVQPSPRLHVPLAAMRANRWKAGDIIIATLVGRHGERSNTEERELSGIEMRANGQTNDVKEGGKGTALGAAMLWPTLGITDVNAMLSLPPHCQSSLPTTFADVPVDVSIDTYSGRVVEASKIEIIFNQEAFEDFDPSIEAYVRTTLASFRLVWPSLHLQLPMNSKRASLRVTSISPEHSNNDALPPVYSVTQRTALTLRASERMLDSSTLPGKSTEMVASNPDDDEQECANDCFVSIGGLEEQVQRIKELVDNAWFTGVNGLRPPTGILLHGPPGTGKTILARALARHLRRAMADRGQSSGPAVSQAQFVHINAPEVLGRFVGQAEQTLRSAFDRARWGPQGKKSKNGAKQTLGGVVFIDEIDALAPSRDSASASDVDRRVVGALLTLMDGLGDPNEPRVVVVAATNRPGSVDSALRRAGRFDIEVEVGVPNEKARSDILKVLLAQVPNNLTDEEIRVLGGRAHGYVGADLSGVVREAGAKVVREVASAKRQTVCLIAEDLEAAMKVVGPSSMREVALEVPRVPWSSIAGQHVTKLRLREAVEWPLRHPQAFIRMGIRPPRGVLLYGPPGCSKTLMAKALATETGLNFMAVKGPEVMSMWVGESEKRVREVFERARRAGPAIVFFVSSLMRRWCVHLRQHASSQDEIDSIATRRTTTTSSTATTRVLSQLLVELDGISPLSNVTVVAATNRPDAIDPALLRPGRIDRMCYVGLPDDEAREEIFAGRIKGMSVDVDVDVKELVGKTKGYSGAECVAVCQEAAMSAMEENVDAAAVCRRHFLSALQTVPPRITKEMLDFYDEFRRKSGLKSVD
ncbi:AAA-domain-containing protein [Gonapodya prolifera JEL478]|uniref:AAA-domain-containing protein n=1 Tax=Gonapodya prolifera (strain JEL478) TaxID=1344416 RepID=A0A139AY96_GONPJ|nr:AAA-domain-containing protein [Gonapodya prolifera JEL478]|eukprot:KXS21718.1 AAA-domain-containing protein [Gonapodya prolifera JEL478]